MGHLQKILDMKNLYDLQCTIKSILREEFLTHNGNTFNRFTVDYVWGALPVTWLWKSRYHIYSNGRHTLFSSRPRIDAALDGERREIVAALKQTPHLIAERLSVRLIIVQARRAL